MQTHPTCKLAMASYSSVSLLATIVLDWNILDNLHHLIWHITNLLISCRHFVSDIIIHTTCRVFQARQKYAFYSYWTLQWKLDVKYMYRAIQLKLKVNWYKFIFVSITPASFHQWSIIILTLADHKHSHNEYKIQHNNRLLQL